MYALDDDRLVISVLDAGHRLEIYRFSAPTPSMRGSSAAGRPRSHHRLWGLVGEFAGDDRVSQGRISSALAR